MMLYEIGTTFFDNGITSQRVTTLSPAQNQYSPGSFVYVYDRNLFARLLVSGRRRLHLCDDPRKL